MDDTIKDKIRRAPQEPGVYHFINSKGKIIYIGKAKNLRARIRSYFQNSNKMSPKNITMLKHIIDLEFFRTVPVHFQIFKCINRSHRMRRKSI